MNDDIDGYKLDFKKLDKSNDRLPQQSDSLIKRKQFPKMLEEYLRAANINNRLAPQWANHIEALISDFKSSYPNSIYLPHLLSKYNKIAVVSADSSNLTVKAEYNKAVNALSGTTAIDFKGLSPDNREVRLSDFSGKVIYIDVWATWCAPCREEIRYSKKLKNEFASNKDIVFLYVSADRSIAKWQKFLKDDTTFSGEHLILTGEELKNFKKSYLLEYLPRYILISKDGKIIDPNAPRPSTGLAKGVIKKLLTGSQ